MNSELQYISDTLLLNKLAYVNRGMRKEAGMMDEFAGSVEAWGKEHIDTSSPGSIAESLGKLLEPSVLFAINPLFGIIDALAQEAFGFSITSIVARILSSVIDKIHSGQQISPSDINGIGSSMLTFSSSGDFLQPLREIEKRGQLILFIKYASSYKIVEMLKNLFGAGPIGKHKGFSIITGIVVWLLKTVLKGAGLLALTGGALSLMHLKNKNPKQENDNLVYVKNNPTSSEIPYMPQHVPNKFKPSGRGEEVHKNDGTTIWWLPIGSSIDSTLINWAKQVYPELTGADEKIRSSVSFNRMVNILNSYKDKGYIEVPKGFNTIKQIVDQFAGDIKLASKNIDTILKLANDFDNATTSLDEWLKLSPDEWTQKELETPEEELVKRDNELHERDKKKYMHLSESELERFIIKGILRDYEFYAKTNINDWEGKSQSKAKIKKEIAENYNKRKTSLNLKIVNDGQKLGWNVYIDNEWDATGNTRKDALINSAIGFWS